MRKFLILLGPPGAGKGVQAQMLKKHFGLAHVSSGELFRTQISQKTSLGVLAKSYMDHGRLVPDDVTLAMILDRIKQPDCRAGVIFDGFPRTVYQALKLECNLTGQGQAVTKVVLFEVPRKVIVERLSNRRFCSQCGKVYNLVMAAQLPKIPDRCDLDGAPLNQRDDDRPEVIENRLVVYERQTAPLVGFYDSQGLLARINADGESEVVLDRILYVLNQKP